jgi:5-methylcytosine-specific restriction endonuclease McrA
VARQLPTPDSTALRSLLPTVLHQAIYKVLYERRTDPPTMKEVQNRVREEHGEAAADQVHFSKRLRELRDVFVIPPATAKNGFTYHLVGVREEARAGAKMSKRLRAKVLRNQRCEMCGRTPGEDGIRLHVDHKIPREWGGPTDEENLQALCSECNEGKKAYFATFDEDAELIRQAISFDEPHRRIGELLKAFDGREIRSDLLDLVASAKQYQEDWQKRTRELREIGWDYSVRRERDERGRVRSFYRLTKSADWPSGNIAAVIKQREHAKKRKESNAGGATS